MREKSFKVYIFRLLKSVQPGLRITKPAVEAVDSIVRVVADKLMDRALLLTTNDDKKTVSSHELETSVRMLLPDVLAKDNVQKSSETVQTFLKSEEDRKGQPVEKAQTRESRCGLVFSVSASEKYVRRFGQVGYHVTATSPVFLAATLENLSKRLLEKTSEVTQLSKKITITVRHLFLAVKKDPSLSTLIDSMGIVLLEGGVEPQTIQNKQHKRLNRKKPSTESTENKEQDSQTTKIHRWRPGTKTVMQIRRLQKSGDMLMQHAPFNRLVREIVRKLLGEEINMRITGDFFTSLQAFVEDRMVLVMTQANRVATHASRETVYARDVELVCNLVHEPPFLGKGLEANTCESNIPEAALRQMALRAGVRRFGDCSTDAYRGYMVQLLTYYLRMVCMCATHHKMQTLNTKLFVEAMSILNLHPSIVAHKRKVGKGKSSSRSGSKASVVDENGEDANEEVAKEENEMDEPVLSDVEEAVTETA